jgi:toxin HigB-1
MIISFRNKDTEKVFNSKWVKSLPKPVQEVGLRRLRLIHYAANLHDIQHVPGNRFEKLKGRLKGYYSISINMQWRVIFKWKNNNAYEVEIIDYH